MTTFYVDTSALAKRYLAERGSAWVLSWVAPAAGNVIVISALTPVEMVSLLERRQREGTLQPAAAALLETSFLAHLQNEYLVIPLDSALLATARGMVKKHRLRTLDAVQLAGAVETMASFAGTITFVSGDKNLLAAAAAEGFATDDPNAHA